MGQVRKLPEKAPGHKTLLSEINNGESVLIMSPPVPPHSLPQTQQQQTPLSYSPGLSSLVALPRFILFLLPRGVSTWCGPQALAGLIPSRALLGLLPRVWSLSQFLSMIQAASLDLDYHILGSETACGPPGLRDMQTESL